MTTAPRATADQCCQRIRWEDLDLAPIRALIQLARDEDLDGSGLAQKPRATGDHSSNLLDENQTATVTLRAREAMVICGLPLSPLVLEAYDANLSLSKVCNDGDLLAKGDAIATITGPVQSLLSAERPLLNFLQRLSGVSTTTRKYADALRGTVTRLLDTRKTTPGYRYLEKYAVACGGGWNHRMGLFDRVMLKDNHIAAFGSDPLAATKLAVATSKKRNPHLLIEMEVDHLEQIATALEAQVDIILLDNFSNDALFEAKSLIQSRAVTEISGGVTLDALNVLKEIGHDFVSTGALSHKSHWVDIGLDWE